MVSDAELGSLPVLKVGGPVGGPGLFWVLGLVPFWPAGELDWLLLVAILSDFSLAFRRGSEYQENGS